MAQRYGIHGLAEAQAYLEEPLLRQRLEEVISVIGEQLELPGQSLEHLMGSGLDAAKTISCLTLFEAADLSTATALLDELGRRCPKSQALLAQQQSRQEFQSGDAEDQLTNQPDNKPTDRPQEPLHPSCIESLIG